MAAARSRYIVGIDLGTTNCAVCYVDTKGKEKPSADIKVFEIPQLVAPGETAPKAMLPSFLYLPGEHELPQGACALPWNPEADRIVGEFARTQGAKVPGRLVSSAKSWLCHSGVDREADILPWGAPSGVRKVSPVEASAAYLTQIRDAWNDQFAKEGDDRKLEAQEVVLTVPASFDEAARELTVAAARQAGFTSLTLLEEPQAAFYCWIVSHQNGWQKEVRAGELILVCDVGGGTTDFSLITVIETPTGPGFKRVAVGDHLMLGGDNIDLALAHKVEAKLKGARLDPEQWSALRFACRTAKEKLLGTSPPVRWPVTIAGRGSKLIGGSIQSELTLAEVVDVVVEGFFPMSSPMESTSRSGRVGVQEFGLPFVHDPAISKHLSTFLRKHRDESSGKAAEYPVRPDAILFNGGALTPTILRDRIVDLINSWFRDDSTAKRPLRVLSNSSLDLAVAYGAAYYGVVRRGGGIRIGGGTARSYYVGFESGSAEGAVVGKPWLCVVPRDAQEGNEIRIDHHDFDLLMGQPVSFPLAGSSIRADDKPGDLVADDPNSILSLPPLRTIMKVGRKAKAERVPVGLEASVTEVGTIELWCRSKTDDRRWRLQIQLRGGSNPGSSSIGGDETDRVILEQSLIDAASEAIRLAFRPGTPEESGPSRLIKRLEETLEAPRSQWPPSALRALWEPLKEVADGRNLSPRHESRWFNLAGYFLRPGTGYPMDESRIKAIWGMFHQGVKHQKDPQCWAEWWILWRRIAAGLNRQHHDEIARRLLPFLLPGQGGSANKKVNRPRPEAHELAEMWRCAAGLERLPSETKETLAKPLLKELTRTSSPNALWCLGRLGARVLLYGPANTVVSRTTAEAWIDILLTRPLPNPTAAPREATELAFALAQIGRFSGDRARDLDPGHRDRIVEVLTKLQASEQDIRGIHELQERQADEESAALGDSLPVGLRLTGTLQGDPRPNE